MYKLITLMATALVLTGCQSALRPYDGVLGYQVISRSSDSVRITYVDEDRRDWTKVTARAQVVCAHELSIAAEQVDLAEIQRDVKSQAVDLSIPIPVGMISRGDDRMSPQGGQTLMATSSQSHSMQRHMKLKSLTADCRKKA